MQEGLANLCLVGSSCTLQRARIETNMPRKRGAAAAGYDKSLESFFRKVGNGHSSATLVNFCKLSWCAYSKQGSFPCRVLLSSDLVSANLHWAESFSR